MRKKSTKTSSNNAFKSSSMRDPNVGIKILYGTCIKDLDNQIDKLTENITKVTYYVSQTYMAVIEYRK